MDAALAQIKELAGKDDGARREAMAALQKLFLSLESVQDTIDRYGHLVGGPVGFRLVEAIAALNPQQHLQSAMVQTGIELGLFKQLSSSPKPMTVDQISGKSGAERQLIGKLLVSP